MASFLSNVSTAPHSLVSSAKLLRVHTTHVTNGDVKLQYQPLRNTSHHWLHLDIEPLTIHWAQSSSQFLIHIVVPLQFRDKDVLQDSVKCFAQVQINDISFISLTQWCCYSTVESTKFGRYDLPLVKLCHTCHQSPPYFPRALAQFSWESAPRSYWALRKGCLSCSPHCLPFFPLFKNEGYVSLFPLHFFKYIAKPEKDKTGILFPAHLLYHNIHDVEMQP